MTNKTENTTKHKEKIKWMNKMDPTEIQGWIQVLVND